MSASVVQPVINAILFNLHHCLPDFPNMGQKPPKCLQLVPKPMPMYHESRNFVFFSTHLHFSACWHGDLAPHQSSFAMIPHDEEWHSCSKMRSGCYGAIYAIGELDVQNPSFFLIATQHGHATSGSPLNCICSRTELVPRSIFRLSTFPA